MKALIAIVVVALIVTGCSQMMPDPNEKLDSSLSMNRYLSPRFSVYASLDDPGVLVDHYYILELRTPISFRQALIIAQNTELRITHIMFESEDGSWGGGVAAYDGPRSTESQVTEIVEESRKRSLKHLELSLKEEIDTSSENDPDARKSIDNTQSDITTLKGAKILATGFQAVIIDSKQLEEIRQDNVVFSSVKKVIFDDEEPDADDADSSNGTNRAEAVTSLAWEPDWHRIQVYTSADGRRVFYRQGKWTSQSRLNNFHSGRTTGI